MAESTDPGGGGERAYGYFVTRRMAEVIELATQLWDMAQSRGMAKLAEGALAYLEGVVADVQRVAVQMAGIADGAIVSRIAETQAPNRPSTDTMWMHILSQPAPLGLVRVALIKELDKIINPQGYGPYWRAQEYGTGVGEGGYGGGGIPSQLDRTIYGTFEPSGGRPDSSQAGEHKGTDLAFQPGGRDAGFGTISVELKGRHFLRDGTAEAGAKYLQAMAEVERKWLPRLDALQAEATAAVAAHAARGRGRAHRYVIRDH